MLILSRGVREGDHEPVRAGRLGNHRRQQRLDLSSPLMVVVTILTTVVITVIVNKITVITSIV